MENNAIKDISGLKNMKYLTNLNISENEIENIDPISDAKHLVILDADRNRIEDVSVLGELKDLARIYLGNNRIKDISALSEINKIAFLWLSNNNIENIYDFENVSAFDIDNQHVSKEMPENRELELPELFKIAISTLYNPTSGVISENCDLSEDMSKIIIHEDAENATVTINGGYFKGAVLMVGKKEISCIKIKTPPIKTEYISGEKIDTTGMEVIAIYNDGTEEEISDYKILMNSTLRVSDKYFIISYTIDDETYGASQEIKVTKKEDDIPPVEHLEVEFYMVETDGDYVTILQPDLKLNMLKYAIRTNGTIEIFDNNDKKVETENTIIGSGYVLKFTKDEERKEFTIVISGDVNGDGKADFKDILQINRHRLGKQALTGAFLKAGDVNNDGKADFKDILKVNKFRLGKITSF